jgi:isoamylase
MIETGSAAPLGATADDSGVNFALFSSAAEAVELCLFDANGGEKKLWLPGRSGNIWHGYVPGCGSGQRYGFRVHGPFAPQDGLRCNPAKLLIDPYARQLDGEFCWNNAVFDAEASAAEGTPGINTHDSAAFVPKGVVVAASPLRQPSGVSVPWADTVIYEANVRGYTMLHPAVAKAERGTFVGMRNKDVLAYLKALGITSLELMPVHSFIDEQHLAKIGLRNSWGYNSIAFFAPASRYAQRDGIAEFRDMVDAIHDAGIEVILDVVYNHTGESGPHGPTLSFRGIDNLAYYSTEPGNPGVYINDTGCGNTVNVDHPVVQELVLDSLRYWHTEMGVDGFRFDLAPILGRHNHGYSAAHPMLMAISDDKQLRHAKLIAEPWDPGPGGYQLGTFPERWAEWNDRYRDTLRRFWRGDPGGGADLARRLHGSADIFEASGRQPTASVNFVTSHDGFTLADVVSFKHRHNKANGEENRDGHGHNYSCNHGVEGPTDDISILALRHRHRLNLLASLLLSQGTPMLLAGDEFGNSQHGNNNAYAQDNETGWLDWSGLATDAALLTGVRELIRLRRDTRLLRIPEYVHGHRLIDGDDIKIDWLRPDSHSMQAEDWPSSRSFSMMLTRSGSTVAASAVAILVNGSDHDIEFRLPASGDWRCGFSSAEHLKPGPSVAILPAFAIACLLRE